MDNVFKKRIEAGLMDEEEGLKEEERAELNELLNLKIEPKQQEKKKVDYKCKIKNLLLAIADFL
jgi:hypothetical protein